MTTQRENAAMLAQAIDRLLPQTQCTRCGYPACRPYAEAIAGGAAGINRCPPGGQAGIVKLAALLGRDPLPLDPECGIEQPLRAAVIDEASCIGCTLCIQACPVDAIVGAPRLMHTVVASLCTGCDLCLPPCPVDCISMEPAGPGASEWTADRAGDSRERYEARNRRLAREAGELKERLAARAAAARSAPDADAKHAAIQAALERARKARAQKTP